MESDFAAGYFASEIFVSAKNISSAAITGTPGILSDLEGVARSGAVKAVNILTANGWLRIQ
jgi:hypothetical protein